MGKLFDVSLVFTSIPELLEKLPITLELALLSMLLGLLLGIGGLHAGDLHGNTDIFQTSPLHEQVELLKDHADGTALLDELLGGHNAQVLAVNDHLTGGGTLQQVDAAHQGGLTRAAHAHDAVDITIVDGDVHIIQCGQLPIGSGEDLGDVF